MATQLDGDFLARFSRLEGEIRDLRLRPQSDGVASLVGGQFLSIGAGHEVAIRSGVSGSAYAASFAARTVQEHAVARVKPGQSEQLELIEVGTFLVTGTMSFALTVLDGTPPLWIWGALEFAPWQSGMSMNDVSSRATDLMPLYPYRAGILRGALNVSTVIDASPDAGAGVAFRPVMRAVTDDAAGIDDTTLQAPAQGRPFAGGFVQWNVGVAKLIDGVPFSGGGTT
jgi:hypothetical protein